MRLCRVHPVNPHLHPIWEGKYSEGSTGAQFWDKGFHAACVGQFSKPLFLGGSVASDICRATRYGYSRYGITCDDPPPSFEARRLRRLKRMFTEEFMTVIQGRLPLEVCENIGRYCLSDYATRLFKDAWGKNGHLVPRYIAFRVTKSHTIWAQHTELEGIQYVESLSTTHRNESGTMLFEAVDGTRVNIYFAEDLLGIREVIMTRDDNTVLTQDDDMKWVVNRRIAFPFWFKLKYDGLKLRDLAITRTKKVQADYRQRRWAVLPSHLNNCQFAPRPIYGYEVSKEPIRAVDWNLPGCRGYSVLMHMDSVCDIIPNNVGGQFSQLTDTSNTHEGAWTYIPIDPDELVVELRQRDCQFPFGLDFPKSLVIRTSNGRSFVLGSHIGTDSTDEWDYELTEMAIVGLSLTEPSRMLYCNTGNAHFWMGFEQGATGFPPAAVSISSPKPCKLSAHPISEFFSSTAKLRGIRTICACRSWRESHDEGIVGMLFTYADGRQRSIGQVRLDCMDAPLVVDSGSFWLGSDRSEEEPLAEGFWPRTHKIKCVEVSKPVKDENQEYFEVPLRGSLEWQSYKNGSYYRHLVFHHESGELQENSDEIDESVREAESGDLSPLLDVPFSIEF
ncbi:hypothetical protein FGADI_4201 [Fusarium gaditjirri]|uniref:Uncharacterized protein n=1 Tax=Fusarium gaditjirri TaxID=282569 RepID=A0A8H4WYZ7_9HYPO|nr:hypothetical protein FGADI_4201 [Fusarium gaditjirri]